MNIKKTVNIVAENPQDGNELPLTVTFTYQYDPGRYYMPNGDPGYPPEESFDIEDVYVTNNTKLDVPEWVTDELIEEIIVDSELIYEEDGYDE